MVIRYDDPPYNPYGERGTTHYHPANEAARRLVQAWVIGKDIEKLCELYKTTSDAHTAKLTLKYLFMELLTLDGHLRRLHSLAKRKGREYQDTLPVDRLEAIYRSYDLAAKGKERLFREIRNGIAAHRSEDKGDQDGFNTARLWDLITPDGVDQILAAVPPLMHCLQEFPITTPASGQRCSPMSLECSCGAPRMQTLVWLYTPRSGNLPVA